MAHVAKFNKGAMGHMLSHYDRSKDNLGSNINADRTNENYNLAVHQQSSQLDFIHQRLSEVKVQNRKDVNVLCDWVITVPKDFPPQEHRKFFNETYKFLEKQYGKENVISAYVHMDEATPHIHFAFIPVVEDKRRGGFKVSAKECVTRNYLLSFHDKLSEHLESSFGRDIGILNEATKDGNRSIEELKRQSATERLAECSKIVSKAHEEVQAIQEHIQPLKAEYEAHKAFIDESDKVSNVSMMYPDYAKVKKSLLGNETVTVPKEMWEARHVSANQIHALKNEREVLENKIQELKDSAPSKKIEKLEQELIKAFKSNRKLLTRLQESTEEINSMKAVLKLNPTLEKAFLSACKDIGQEISRDGQSR